MNLKHVGRSSSTLILACVLVGVGSAALLGQKTNYGVTVPVVKPAVLAKVKTYSWVSTQPAPLKATDALIVAAVDRELAAQGLTKITEGKAEVQATYASLKRTDVDARSKADTSKDATGTMAEFAVGTLVVELRDPATKQPVFRVRIDKPIGADRSKLKEVIDEAVKAMFEKYPKPVAPKG
jgi:hypothetical protein